MHIHKIYTNEQGKTWGLHLDLFRNDGYKGNPLMCRIQARAFGCTFISWQTRNFRMYYK
jgi:hypothetical protein